MSLSRETLTESVQHNALVPKRRSKELVDATLDLIASTLASGEHVMISRFGKFDVRDKGSRRGRNPHTGESLTLDARRTVTFKPSGKLREKLNGDG